MQVLCPRCGGDLFQGHPKPHEPPAGHDAEAPSIESPEFELDALPDLDTLWNSDRHWEEQQSRAQRLLASAARSSPRRIDPPNAVQRKPHISFPAAASQGPTLPLLAHHLAVLAGGGTLLAGSLMLAWGQNETESFWRIAGIVAGAVGQLIVVAGLLGLLLSLWRAYRRTQQSLQSLDQNLQGLRERVAQLRSAEKAADEAGSGSHAAPLFAAPPPSDTQALMAEIQSQMRLLARRVRDDERAA